MIANLNLIVLLFLQHNSTFTYFSSTSIIIVLLIPLILITLDSNEPTLSCVTMMNFYFIHRKFFFHDTYSLVQIWHLTNFYSHFNLIILIYYMDFIFHIQLVHPNTFHWRLHISLELYIIHLLIFCFLQFAAESNIVRVLKGLYLV